MARKRRTKAEILAAQSEGLGDTVEKVLEVTGVAKVAKWVLGEDIKMLETALGMLRCSVCKDRFKSVAITRYIIIIH